MSEYASHYKHGSIETADKIEAVTELLGKSDMVGGAHMFLNEVENK